MADYPTPNRQWVQDREGNEDKGYTVFIPGGTPPDFEDRVRIAYDELMSLLLKKHRDYGSKNISDAPGGALNGLRVRMHDKLARINNLVDSGVKPMNESLEDSFKDMANYAIIGLLVLRGDWNKK